MSHKIIKQDSLLFCIDATGIQDNLESGQYKVGVTQKGQVYLEQMTVSTDKILRLPGSEFELATVELEHFLSDLCKDTFGQLGYTYNDAWLFFGRHGTGKSYLVNRIAEMVIERGGIVLFDPDPRILPEAYKIVDNLQKDRLVLVIMEEFDETANNHEEAMLKLLDGQSKRANTLFAATTNFIKKIPKRMLRPGRFPFILQVKEPSREARKAYLDVKLSKVQPDMIDPILEATEGFTIDEVKETVRSVVALKRNLPDTVQRLRLTAGLGYSGSSKPDEMKAALNGFVKALTGQKLRDASADNIFGEAEADEEADQDSDY